MNRNTIELEFGDGQYLFALPLPQIAELQRKTGAGIGGLYARVVRGCIPDPKGDKGEWVLNPSSAEFYALDLIETIRHALIGGAKGTVNGEEVKVTPLIANSLVDTYVLGAPLIDAWKTAATVLGVCVLGYDPPKKDPPAEERAPAKKKTGKAGSTTSMP
jgi:hypothetical protein